MTPDLGHLAEAQPAWWAAVIAAWKAYSLQFLAMNGRSLFIVSLLAPAIIWPIPSAAQVPPWPWEEPAKNSSENPTNPELQPPRSPVSTKGIVRAGDTLLTLSQRYGITMQDILRLNPGLDTRNLKPGTQITLVRDSCELQISVMQNSISLLRSAYTNLRRVNANSSRQECFDSQVRLSCFNGSCGVYFNSGQHGYHPSKCNIVRISRQTWRWCGDQPVQVAMDMWKHLKDGVEVATNLIGWPSYYTNSREYPLEVNRAKILTYNASLGLSTPLVE
jgi:LysM repeat protein